MDLSSLIVTKTWLMEVHQKVRCSLIHRRSVSVPFLKRHDNLSFNDSFAGPEAAQNVQKLIHERGYQFVDAPVSGGVPGAINGTLTFMVGGKPEEFNKVKDVLQDMGGKITHCGDYGMGQAAKLANNMMLAISMVGLAETMNLAIRLGLDPKTFADIVNSSTGRSWASEVYSPVPNLCPNSPSNNNYAGGFSTGLITKDLGLASNCAVSSNTPIALGSLAHQVCLYVCYLFSVFSIFEIIYRCTELCVQRD